MKLKDITLENIRDYFNKIDNIHWLFTTTMLSDSTGEKILKIEVFNGDWDDDMTICYVKLDTDYDLGDLIITDEIDESDLSFLSQYPISVDEILTSEYSEKDWYEDDDGDINISDITPVINIILDEIKNMYLNIMDYYWTKISTIKDLLEYKTLKNSSYETDSFEYTSDHNLRIFKESPKEENKDCSDANGKHKVLWNDNETKPFIYRPKGVTNE